jgi:hypothetical protein
MAPGVVPVSPTDRVVRLDSPTSKPQRHCTEPFDGGAKVAVSCCQERLGSCP